MDNEKIKIYAGVIAMAITAVTSITTAFIANSKADKAGQEETAKASYKELSMAVEQISKDQVAISKDIASLRGYLAGMHQQSIPDVTDIPVSGKAKVSLIRPGIAGQSTSRVSAGVSAPPPPPAMGAKPKEYKPPALSDLKPD